MNTSYKPRKKLIKESTVHCIMINKMELVKGENSVLTAPAEGGLGEGCVGAG